MLARLLAASQAENETGTPRSGLRWSLARRAFGPMLVRRAELPEQYES